MYTVKNAMIGIILILTVAGLSSHVFFPFDDTTAYVKNASADPLTKKNLLAAAGPYFKESALLIDKTRFYKDGKQYPIPYRSGSNLHVFIENKGSRTLAYTLASPQGTLKEGVLASGTSTDQKVTDPTPGFIYQLSVRDTAGRGGSVKIQAWAGQN
ncbi:hypothetical protein [Bacillus testis]|uniref:hypothetical protein n=1 Tax=Bacillus testis TaxID=1622072 RepID=UPI00067EC55A|nr:hypothetical protein [Bacillus testis]